MGERVNGGDARDETFRPPSAGECEDAATFAAALEGSAPDAEADDALRAARFLEALGRATTDDEVAAARLRRALVARASASPRRAFLRAAAAAAAVVLVAVLAARARPRAAVSAALLAEREVAAERAVARSLSGRGDSLDAGVAVFDALLRERASAASPSAASAPDPSASPALTPTAGGPT
jgi:hypothetical protein